MGRSNCSQDDKKGRETFRQESEKEKEISPSLIFNVYFIINGYLFSTGSVFKLTIKESKKFLRLHEHHTKRRNILLVGYTIHY